MPVSGVLLHCEVGRTDAVRREVAGRANVDVHEVRDSTLIVVTDTPSLEEDRRAVESLERIPGVAAVHVAFCSVEDLAEAALGSDRKEAAL